ncbi:MAG: hypothetical protein AWU54_1807 [Candidatus Frackibacter sp. T328-2]|nr:MAG: hypothetical protein AWU54_1807 [Candidatus Frackibacter sp. T328-2]
MKKKLVIIVVLLSLLVVCGNNVLASYVVKDYKLKTKKQVKLFKRHKKDPLKASLTSIIPGGGHIYNGRADQALFYILENVAIAYTYKMTKEPFYLKAGLVIKLLEMSSAYDLSLQHNKNLKKAIVDFTKKVEISENHIGLRFSF